MGRHEAARARARPTSELIRVSDSKTAEPPPPPPFDAPPKSCGAERLPRSPPPFFRRGELSFDSASEPARDDESKPPRRLALLVEVVRRLLTNASIDSSRACLLISGVA